MADGDKKPGRLEALKQRAQALGDKIGDKVDAKLKELQDKFKKTNKPADPAPVTEEGKLQQMADALNKDQKDLKFMVVHKTVDGQDKIYLGAVVEEPKKWENLMKAAAADNGATVNGTAGSKLRLSPDDDGKPVLYIGNAGTATFADVQDFAQGRGGASLNKLLTALNTGDITAVQKADDRLPGQKKAEGPSMADLVAQAEALPSTGASAQPHGLGAKVVEAALDATKGARIG